MYLFTNQNKFHFVHTTNEMVEKLINNLNSISGLGLSEIPTRVIKVSNNALVPILTELLNHCIDIVKLPTE